MKASPALLCAVLALLSLSGARAQSGYKVQPLFAVGDTIAGVKIGPPPYAGQLGDREDFVYVATIAGGGEAMFYSADGKITPIVIGDQVAPGGRWPQKPDMRPAALNRRGAVTFVSQVTIGEATDWGVFLWDPQSQKTTARVLAGMPAVNGLTFVRGAIPEFPALNNRDEIAFSLYVPDATGKAEQAAFFQGMDGRIVPIALPGQVFPGAKSMLRYLGDLSMNDAGQVAFRVRRQGDATLDASAYLWEAGTLTPIATPGDPVGGGRSITRVQAVYLNNKDRSVLLAANTSELPNRTGLYRFAEGKITPVLVPGQELPDGGKFATLSLSTSGSGLSTAWYTVSRATEAGEHAFIANREGGGQGIYRVEPDGRLTLVFQSGTDTDLGKITSFEFASGISLNSRGQVAVTVRITGRPVTTVLLTPP